MYKGSGENNRLYQLELIQRRRQLTRELAPSNPSAAFAVFGCIAIGCAFTEAAALADSIRR